MIETVYLVDEDNKILDKQFTLGLRETVFIKMFALDKTEGGPQSYWEVDVKEYERDLL